MRYIAFLLAAVLFGTAAGYSQTTKVAGIPVDRNIYINPDNGSDLQSGSKDNPLKTLYEAARRVNNANGKGRITIYLSEGIYNLDATVTFHPANWWFTKEERLTVRAEMLPDDTDWDPSKMPVVISTMPLDFKPYGNTDPFHGASYGIQVETSHVTIQGLRILGTPVHERPKDGYVRRNYPIVREGRNLDDLRITQCLFLGDINVLPNHVSILASGQGIVVDHCVFYHVKDAVVFWFSDKPALNCEMHHNLIVGNYGAAVWSWSLASDFKYYNNVVADANVFWVLQQKEDSAFTISNSMLLGYKGYVNKGGGPPNLGVAGNEKKLIPGENMVIRKEAKIEVEEDQTKKNYLHLKPGSMGYQLGTGLFLKQP